MKKYTIAGIGELLWDVLENSEELGGAPVNFVYHVAALGAEGIPISTIGLDERGKKSVAALQRGNMRTDALSVTENYDTGYVYASLDQEGVASYTFPDEVA